jgi:putative transposase
MYKLIDEYCFRSKNLYNYANYMLRQEFINNGKYIKYYDMAKILKTHELYKKLMSQASQCTLQVLDRSWKSYFNGMKDWKKNPHKYLGMPKLPKYKKKDGRFPWFLKNNQTYIKDGYLYFRMRIFNGYGFKTKCNGRLIAVRFIPKGNIYMLEIIYEKEIQTTKEDNGRYCSIDLGVNNFVTMVNNIGNQPIIINGKGIKSINQYYNKEKSKKQSYVKKRNKLNWCKQLNAMNQKRYNRLKNYIHHASKFIVEYCNSNQINTLVIGLNKTWKQEVDMGKIQNQKFVFIPYDLLINQLKYKCEDKGINIIINEESYSSGTSFLDNELPIKENYNKSRRVYRGLFQSNIGKYINADVNGSFQIMRKVFPNVVSDGIEGCLIPIIINLVKI